MSLAPDIFSMPVIGLFLGLAIAVLLVLFIAKMMDFVSFFKGNFDIVEVGFTLTRFAILIVPLFFIIFTAFQGQIPNAIDMVTGMLSALFLWGIVKIIYELIKEVF